MAVRTDKRAIRRILDRGIIAEVFPSRKAFFERLASGQRMRMYLGVDPTSDSLHLSHAKNFMLLEEFRRLGHEITVLIGDFTAQIGDPSGRSAARVQMTLKEARDNAKGLIRQLKPLLDFEDKKNPPFIRYNSAWLKRINLHDTLSLAAHFTAQQMFERDMFQERIRNNAPIYLHEFLYPLLQGYDSVALEVDVELCGTDQIFNALVGRTLVKRLRNKEKFVVAVNLLENPKTGTMMSKSKGTGIFLSSSPVEMYGAIMAQPDEMIEPLLTNCTRIPLSEKKPLFALGPRAAKGRVAFEIVRKIYGEKEAKMAEETFKRTFQEKRIPASIPTLKLRKGEDVAERLVELGVVSSKTEWRRLIQHGAVQTAEGRKVKTVRFQPERDVVLKIGKRRFVKITAP